MSQPCPADNCGGKIEQEIIGSWANPDVEYHTTCRHGVYRCDGCGEWKAGTPDSTNRQYHAAHTAGGGATGQYETYEYCPNCTNEGSSL